MRSAFNGATCTRTAVAVCLSACCMCCVIETTHAQAPARPNQVAIALPFNEERIAKIVQAADSYKKLREARDLAVKGLEKINASVEQARTRYNELNNQRLAIETQIDVLSAEYQQITNSYDPKRASPQETQNINNQRSRINDALTVLRTQRSVTFAQAGLVEREVSAMSSQAHVHQTAVERSEDQEAALLTQWFALLDLYGKLSKDEHRAALPKIEELLTREPLDAGLTLARGATYWRLGEYPDAKRDLEDVVKSGSLFRQAAMAALGAAMVDEGDRTKGLALLGRAMKEAPKAVGPILLRGLAHARGGNLVEAGKDFSRAARLDKKDVEAGRLLALAYSAADRKSSTLKRQAMVDAQRAVKKANDRDWAALYTLAICQADNGDQPAALAAAARAAQLAVGENLLACQRLQKQLQAGDKPTIKW